MLTLLLNMENKISPESSKILRITVLTVSLFMLILGYNLPDEQFGITFWTMIIGAILFVSCFIRGDTRGCVTALLLIIVSFIVIAVIAGERLTKIKAQNEESIKSERFYRDYLNNN